MAMVTGYPGLDAIEQDLASALGERSMYALGAEVAAMIASVQTPEVFEVLVPAA